MSEPTDITDVMQIRAEVNEQWRVLQCAVKRIGPSKTDQLIAALAREKAKEPILEVTFLSDCAALALIEITIRIAEQEAAGKN